MIKPQGQKRLHDQTAGKGVKTEEGGERQDERPRLLKRLSRGCSDVRPTTRHAPIHEKRRESHGGVEQEHRLQGLPDAKSHHGLEKLWNSRSECTESA